MILLAHLVAWLSVIAVICFFLFMVIGLAILPEGLPAYCRDHRHKAKKEYREMKASPWYGGGRFLRLFGSAHFVALWALPWQTITLSFITLLGMNALVKYRYQKLMEKHLD